MKKKKGSLGRKTVSRSPAKKAAKLLKEPGSRIKKSRVKSSDQNLQTHLSVTSIKPFPIVGIGSSAGGLEAFTELLQNLPHDLGMALVYIQHLSPRHESFLAEILERKTKMKVVKVKNNTPLRKDHVYVVPARYFVSVNDGKLKLTPQGNESNLHAIDHFLTSLAPLYQQNAIGIILSGTGSDGTLGLMSIKAEGGITFAQDDSAHYQGMPYHATQMGCVDFVMSPERIAKELASLIKHPYSVSTTRDDLLANGYQLRKIHMIMHNKRGVDFSHYKQSTIHRRILRRMALNHLNNVDDYADLLKEKREEVDALFQDLLITVTNFFRDPSIYQALTNKILAALLKGRKPNDAMRIWIPGCATGEEAISFAIVILEYLAEKALTTPVLIFATDLNEKAIERARAGIYSKPALINVSPQRLRKFFTRVDSHYQVVKSIRDMCVFASHNLLRDPPFSRMDIISCQNVLIYLESEPQSRIMHAFHYALKPNGFLLLGKSETVGPATDLFQLASKQYKAYTKRMITAPLQIDYTTQLRPVIEIAEEEGKPELPIIKKPDLDKETDRLLLTRYVPASVLVNKDLEIIRFRGETSRFLGPASGRASLHLLRMIRDDLAFHLRILLERAKKSNRTVKKEGVVASFNGTTQEISIEVVPVRDSGKDSHFLIVFKDNGNVFDAEQKDNKKEGTKKHGAFASKRVATLQAQLKESRDTVKIITEDFEATREELQASNEEVLSSNEELQSINEELETSREELQSTNEELRTINEELQIRNAELKVASEYTQAVIETMHESLLMLTNDLTVRSANKGFYQTFHVTPEETEGKFLYELGNGQWDIPDLRKQLKMVQSRDIPLINFEVTHDFPSIGRKSMVVNAHKFPKKEGDEALILLAIQDLTLRKEMEETLKANEERFRLLVQNASDIITVFDQDGTIKYESPAIESVLGYKTEERVGRNINMDPIVHPDDRDLKIQLLKNSIAKPKENVYGEFRLRHKNGTYRTIDAIFKSFLHDPKIGGVIANYRDITERKKLEMQKDEFVGVASHELKTPVTSIKAYTQILEDNFSRLKDFKSRELVRKMNAQVDRLTTLISDLLDFTRIEGGKLKFREEEYELNDLIYEITTDMQRMTKQHKIVRKLGERIKLNGDRYRTGQVLVNLLSNAIKYSPNGKQIIVSSKSTKQDVDVCIRDFGVGIESNQVEKVFDRFFRVSEPTLNTFPGLGLGLYIAREIIRRQGGKIWLNSEVGKGSTFCFSLPVAKNPNSAKTRK